MKSTTGKEAELSSVEDVVEVHTVTLSVEYMADTVIINKYDKAVHKPKPPKKPS